MLGLLKWDKLCVVIPAFNEALVIGRCIESLIQAGLSPPDIYVIDDGSTDGTYLEAAQRAVNVITSGTNRGKAKAIEMAIEEFRLTERYEYMALLDADTYVNPDYVRCLIEGFEKWPSAVIICGQAKSSPHNWLTAYRAFVYLICHFAYKGGQSVSGSILVAAGCASAYRCSILGKIDWSSETLVEDMDITVQVHRKDLGNVCYEAGAVTYTQDPRTLGCYIGQVNRWFSGTWQVVQKHRLPWGGQKIDVEFFFLLTEGLLFSLIVVSAPFFAFSFPLAVVGFLAMEIFVSFLAAMAIGVFDRRLDVVKWSFLFVFMRVVDCCIFLFTFINHFVLKNRYHRWFRVARYSNLKEVRND